MPDRLTLILSEIQRRGGIGRGDIAVAIAHAQQFVDAAGDPDTMIDLGSGGGLPGLVLAVRLPTVAVTLIERRAKRADLLRYGVHALDLSSRVQVVESDVRTFAQTAVPVDLVTARSFAAPVQVLTLASPLLREGGMLLVSEPPSSPQDRWDGDVAGSLGFRDLGQQGAVRRWARHTRFT